MVTVAEGPQRNGGFRWGWSPQSTLGKRREVDYQSTFAVERLTRKAKVQWHKMHAQLPRDGLKHWVKILSEEIVDLIGVVYGALLCGDYVNRAGHRPMLGGLANDVSNERVLLDGGCHHPAGE